MQFVLLSGGSGKGLWPLSNEARSKQFLRLLRNPATGELESMIQRLVRQIKTSDEEAEITIATNELQKDAITTHLGNEVEIVAEPSRRDTFPAVCLACEYIDKVKKVARDEVIVVVPCDQFADLKYFETLKKMAHIAAKEDAGLVVMGILPDYPSQKYGYIHPADHHASNEEFFTVEEFKEKPDEHTAIKLLEKGAYWNSGAFAFKLGFLLDRARKYVSEDSFEGIKENYENYPAISFDYEVAENTSDMRMVPYSGLWKDLGTWDNLLSEVESQTKGDVISENNIGTHVLNELQIPILCLGTRNLVVAASPDGILIAEKGNTERIKEFTEKFKSRPMFEERRWGTYQVIDHVTFPDGYETLTKRLTLNKGCSISYQLHECRDETWTFIEGEGIMIIDDRKVNISRGDTVSIKKGQKHALYALTTLSFIEVQAGTNLIETDIKRFPLEW